MTFHNRFRWHLLALASWILLGESGLQAVGTWTALAHAAPAAVDTMLLLSDGTVMAANAGGRAWYQLIPDNRGSYINGTWRSLASMHDTRLYYSSAVLRDGRVFVAGGEYGTGKGTAEVYDPLLDRWSYTALPWQSFSDAVSKILPDGRMLVAPVGPIPSGSTVVYDPVADSWLAGGKLFRGSYQDEASWVKLPDDSILTIDPFGTNSERYLPASNVWINDANVPVPLYDPFGNELGAGFVLADGRAFFLGSSGHTAFYAPSGSTAPGAWTLGPDFPNGQGTPDAPAAMMVSGKILCVTSATPSSSNHFPTPASFYEYDPVANAFAIVSVPSALSNLQQYVTRMLDLPDGTVLFSYSADRLYVYQPDGSPLASGKPAISGISQNDDGSFHLTGTLLNGISEGAAYGDDAQMSSSYPLVRLTNSSGNVYYCRTYNWSGTSIMTGNRQLTTEFALPPNLVPDTFSLVVSANGNASDPVLFTTTVWNGTPSGNWDTSTTNWLKSGVTASFNQSDFVIFDDSFTGSSSVNLAMTLIPGGVLFKNSRTGYVLGGNGLLSGPGGLVMSGANTLELTETGGDNFSGGITVNSGTLILDTANSAVSGGMTVAAGAAVIVGNHDFNGGLPSGNITNNGVLIFDQTGDFILGDAISGFGALTKNDANRLTLTAASTWSGTTLINAGTLELAGAASITATANISIAAGATLCVTNRMDGMFTLTRGQILQGNGTLAGTLTALPGSILMPGTNAAEIGALTVLSNVTLEGALSMKIDPLRATNDLLRGSSISFGGVLRLSNLSGAPLTLATTFRLFTASNYSGAFSAILPPIPAPGLAWNTNHLTSDGTLSVLYTPGVTWGGHIDGNWDLETLNWSSEGSSAAYAQGDQVTFDDSVSRSTTVTLTQPLQPASVTFNNSSSNYVISGSGSLTLTNGLLKNLAGTVRLSETGGDNLSGGLTLNNGTLILDNNVSSIGASANIGAGATLQLGFNDTGGSLPPGPIFLNGQLVLNRSDDLTISQPIIGVGSLLKTNSDLVKISQNNLNWTGAVTVAQGILQMGAMNALGRGTNVLITVNSGATLDLNGMSGTNAVVASGAGIGGNGAVVNDSPASAATPGLAFLTLAGNTTIGGVSRWDLRPAGPAPDTAGAALAGLSTRSQPFSLTKIGANYIGIVSANIDPGLTYINVQSGTLGLEGDLPGLGNSSTALTVSSNATLEFQNLGMALNKSIVLNDGATILNGAGANTLLGPTTLAGNCTFNINGSYLWMNGGAISGPGNLIKTGTATLRLSAANTFKGSTLINAGTLSLWLSGVISSSTNINIAAGATLRALDRTDKTWVLIIGQTLRGNGSIAGTLIAHAGSTIIPGPDSATLGALTISSNVTMQGATVMKLNPVSGVSDVLHCYLMTYGGTLTLTNLSAMPLTTGNNFRLFAASKYAGTFAAITPPKPGPGLQWDTSKLAVNGNLSVAALPQPGITSFSLAGPDLVINGTNGVAGALCSVLMSTNVAVPAAQWTAVASTTLNSNGNFTQVATNSVDLTAPQRFYRLQMQ